MGSFSTPLSGLTAAQGQLQSVSNNLANINTDGYKDQTLTFADVFSQTGATNGSGDPLQTGSGVTTSSTDSDFTEGSLNVTGTASNMALSGNGFFVTKGPSGSSDYTRAGDFTTNNAGQITTPSGELLLGYPAVNGVVNTATTLQPLQVGTGVTSPAVASTTMNISANLNAGATPGATSATTSTLPVFDSLGASHTLTVTYTMTSANNWTYSVTMPTADLLPTPAAPVPCHGNQSRQALWPLVLQARCISITGVAAARLLQQQALYSPSPPCRLHLCRWGRRVASHLEPGDRGNSDHHPDRYGKRNQCHQHEWVRQRHALHLRRAAQRNHQRHFLQWADTCPGTGRCCFLLQQSGTGRGWQQQLPGERCLWCGRGWPGWNRRTGYRDWRFRGAVKREYRYRVRQADCGPASLLGKCQVDYHVQPGLPGDHRNAAVKDHLCFLNIALRIRRSASSRSGEAPFLKAFLISAPPSHCGSGFVTGRR